MKLDNVDFAWNQKVFILNIRHTIFDDKFKDYHYPSLWIQHIFFSGGLWVGISGTYQWPSESVRVVFLPISVNFKLGLGLLCVHYHQNTFYLLYIDWPFSGINENHLRKIFIWYIIKLTISHFCFNTFYIVVIVYHRQHWVIAIRTMNYMNILQMGCYVLWMHYKI